jgi:hypothetical protein
MKTKITTLTLLLALGMLFGSCQNKTSEGQGEATENRQTANAVFQCPMKCEGEKVYDKPGQCPVCNMDLEEVDAKEEHLTNDSTHNSH